MMGGRPVPRVDGQSFGPAACMMGYLSRPPLSADAARP